MPLWCYTQRKTSRRGMRKGLMSCSSHSDARVVLLLTLFPNDDPNVIGDNYVLIHQHPHALSTTRSLVTLSAWSLLQIIHSYFGATALELNFTMTYGISCCESSYHYFVPSHMRPPRAQDLRCHLIHPLHSLLHQYSTAPTRNDYPPCSWCTSPIEPLPFPSPRLQ